MLLWGQACYDQILSRGTNPWTNRMVNCGRHTPDVEEWAKSHCGADNYGAALNFLYCDRSSKKRLQQLTTTITWCLGSGRKITENCTSRVNYLQPNAAQLGRNTWRYSWRGRARGLRCASVIIFLSARVPIWSYHATQDRVGLYLNWCWGSRARIPMRWKCLFPHNASHAAYIYTQATLLQAFVPGRALTTHCNEFDEPGDVM